MASEKKFWKFFKKAGSSKISRRIGLGLGLSIVFLGFLFVVFNLVYNDRILPKTYIGSINFGGLHRSEAENLLNTLEENSQNGTLGFLWQDKNYELTVSNLEINWQKENQTTLNALFAVGRSGSLFKIIREQVHAVFRSNEILASFNYNQVKLDEFLKTIAQDVDLPEKDAAIEIKDNKPVVIPEEIGRRFSQDSNRKIALEAIGSFDFRLPTAFLVEEVLPKVTTLGAQIALRETERLLSLQLILKAQNKTFYVYPKDIADFITFVTQYGQKGVLGASSTDSNNFLKEMVVAYSLLPELSEDKVGAFVDKIAAEVNQPAQDPKFEVSAGKVQTFQVAQTGYEIDKDQSIALIIDALKKGEMTVDLPVKVTEPKIASSDPAQAGITELIGEGRTSWRGSPANRIHNLTLGANKISGTIVKPGEEFSTLAAIGDVGPATGFLPELVIKNATQVVPDYGGGLCQVSTTLFRAIIYSGLKVTARTPHSFRVSYYEPPVGMDATIFSPAPDLKFINDMSTPILIWAIAGNNSLVFQFYGTKDSRQVSISDPVIFDYVSPPGPVYSQSDTLAAGEIRQIERALSGATASFTYKVTATDGTVLENETFVSKYVPLPNTYLYGPGTTGIPGQEEQTQPAPEPAPTPAPTATPSPTKSPKK